MALVEELEHGLATLEICPVRRQFESLATFYRNELVRSVDGVKRPETRARNLEAAMERLRHPG